MSGRTERPETGPTWRDAGNALELLKSRFGAGFIVQGYVRTPQDGRPPYGFVWRLIWRRSNGAEVVDFRAVWEMWPSATYRSVPSLILGLALDLQQKLAAEGFDMRQPVGFGEPEGAPVDWPLGDPFQSELGA